MQVRCHYGFTHRWHLQCAVYVQEAYNNFTNNRQERKANIKPRAENPIHSISIT